METRELHRGRLIDHLEIVVADAAKSRAFYDHRDLDEVVQLAPAA